MNPTLLIILVRQLVQYEIDYLIVGGVAKILYQEKQYTKDIDVLVRMSDGNHDKLAKLLKSLHFDLNQQEFADNGIVRIVATQGTIEFLSRLDGVSVEEAFMHKVSIPYHGINIDVISQRDLNKNLSAVKEKLS